MTCPICREPVEARFTSPGRTYKVGVMLQCGVDSRHFRAFVNDEAWVKKAKELGDPLLLLQSESGT